MNDIDAAASGIRAVESRGDYRYQQDFTADGARDRKVGAYGIVQSKWPTLTESLGYRGAQWQDPKMQDVIAKEALKRHYEQLGSWELAVVAFRFGSPVAQFLKESGYTEPESMESSGYGNVANYVRSVRRSETRIEQPVEGRLKPPEQDPTKSPQLDRAQSIIRDRLVGMRNANRNAKEVSDGSNEDIQQVGDTDVPAATQ